MSRLSTAGLILVLVLSGCGGSGHHSTGQSTGTGSPGSPAPAATGTTAATAPATTAQTTATSPPAGSGATTGSGGASGSGARIPATFTIKAGQATPPTVSAPANVAIQVTIVSADGKAHTALVRTAPPHTIQVAAGAKATLLLPGQADGRYVIVLDHGAGLATLLVGGSPGP